MKDFIKKLLDYLHENPNNLRIDTAAHPFSLSLDPGDHRITTRYSEKDFKQPYSSTTHEFGHALYNMQCHEDLCYTPIWGGSSLVIHESQSSFWENLVGRSKEFIALFYKEIYRTGIQDKHKLEDIYEYFNLVRPSLIRTEADEVTYHLHILIRFEIEKEIMEGKINAKDLQKIWKNKYKSYLGIEPARESEGVLQDVHWSQGLIGYFPTYSIGTALSAMWGNKIEKDLGNLKELLKNKDGIKKIKEWLKKNIHQYGSTFTFKELVRKTCGEDFDSKYLLNYLEKKYKELY
jgi:carboxypeptidase Taq